MAKNFTAQVDEIILKTNERITAVVRESVQRTVDEAQTPVAKGGKMRVDTGFLRASGQMSLSGMPSGPVRGDAEQRYEYSDASVITTLASVEPGKTIYFGWTANYAKYREAYDGFLGAAVQNWPSTVASVVREVVNRIR